MIRIKKLTPPQIAAIEEAFPNCVEGRIIVTTASTATFRDLVGREPWQPHHVQKMLVDRLETFHSMGLANVLHKVETRPDLVEVSTPQAAH